MHTLLLLFFLGFSLSLSQKVSKMSTLKFCRECNNILFPKLDKDQKILLYACRYCDHQEIADNNCIYIKKVHHSAGERTQVLHDVAADPNLPCTKSVRCARCDHGEAYFSQVEVVSTKCTFVSNPSTSLLLGYCKRRGGYDADFCLLQPKL